MTVESFMAFGGPHAGQWFPLGADPVRYEFAPEELDERALLATLNPVAPAPQPHRYNLARFGFLDWRDNVDTTLVCWVHAPEHAELVEEIGRTLLVIAWLAGYRPRRPYLPRAVDLFA